MKLAILLAVLVVYSRCDDGERSDRIARQTIASPGFSIPKAILALALDVGRCRSASPSECATNTVYSPLSIASTLTMLLMGNFEYRFFDKSQSLQVKLMDLSC